MAAQHTLAVKIELQSPLLLTRQQVGFVWESETFIPGGMLRGAAAEVAARSVPQAERVGFLKDLFEGVHAPRFNHAYAGLDQAVGLLPLTARACKYAPGFQRAAQDPERHGVIDTLVQALCGKNDEQNCHVCDKKMTPIEARPYAAVQSGTEEWRYVAPEPLFQRIGRSAVSRERGAVAERMLYTLETISAQMLRDELDREGQPLRANTLFHTTVNLNATADLQQWQQWLTQVPHLGGAKSRGLGQVAITVTPATVTGMSARDWALAPEALAKGDPQVNPNTPLYALNLAGRIQAFNQKVYASLAACGAERPEVWYFTVDLQADMLVSATRGGHYQVCAEDWGFPSDVFLWRAVARYTQSGGWSAAWGLPKPTAPAWAAGSVFVFSVPIGDEALAKKVLQQCEKLEQNGWGLRREEGFGAVQICTPFHLGTEVTL